MLSKSEKAILKKLDPLFIKLLNDECLPFVFSYLDGRQIKTMGSREARLKMDEAVRDRAWLKAFILDEKEMMRESKQDYFDAEGGDLCFMSNAKNVS